jgi:hypothetical protein
MTLTIRYRLHTEYRDNLETIVARHVPGATIIQGIGLWHGAREECAIVEILMAPSVGAADAIAYLANDIRITNEQTSVLLTTEYVSMQEFT